MSKYSSEKRRESHLRNREAHLAKMREYGQIRGETPEEARSKAAAWVRDQS